MSSKKKLTYSQAIEELDKIINDIESENINVDILTQKVRRAAYLIKFCKVSLRTTEKEVKEALLEIEDKHDAEEIPGDEDVEPEP